MRDRRAMRGYLGWRADILEDVVSIGQAGGRTGWGLTMVRMHRQL